MDPSMNRDATAIINPTVNSPAFSTSAITTTTLTLVGPANPIRRRKSRFSLAVPILESSALDALKTDLGATTNSMLNVPTSSEMINSASPRQNNPRLHTLSSADSRSSSPAKDVVENCWKRGPADRKNNVLNALHFKKQPSKTVIRPTKRSFTPVSYRSSSSSSAYPRSTSPGHFSHVCNRATIKDHGVVDANRPDPSTAPTASNNYNRPQQPGADGLNNDLLKQLRDELSQLGDEVKLLRQNQCQLKDEVKLLRQNQHLQTPPSSLQLAQLLQPSVPFGLSQPILDMILGVAAAVQQANAPGTSFSIPPPIPYWSQEVPLPYAEQQPHRMPAPTWQEPEYYPPTSPLREHGQLSGRGRYHEVARPDTAPITGLKTVPENCVRHPGPWRETGHGDGRIFPVIYERETDAGAGKYGPRQRSARGVIRERRSSARQPVKYAGPYKRPPADKGWSGSQIGTPNDHDIGHRICPGRAPSSTTATFASNDRGTEQNRDLHRKPTQRYTPLRSTTPLRTTDSLLPMPPPAPPVGHGSGEMFSSTHPIVQTFFQPVLVPHEPPTPSGATKNVRPGSRTPLSARVEPSGDGARDRPVGPQTPLAAQFTPSIYLATENWEDNYEQEEATVPQNVDSKEPSGLLRTWRVLSPTYDDVTVNPWS